MLSDQILQRTPSIDASTANGASSDPFLVMARHSPAAVMVTLSDLGYKVKVPGEGGKGTEWRPLLNNINAIFRPGTMTALMGSSGAGKSTLMDVIAGRKTGGDVRCPPVPECPRLHEQMMMMKLLLLMMMM